MKTIVLAALMILGVTATQVAQAAPVNTPQATEQSQPATDSNFGPGGTGTDGGWG